MDSEKRNLMLAILSSILIFGGYYYFYERPNLEKQAAEVQQTETPSVASVTPVASSAIPASAPVPVPLEASYEDSTKGPRLSFKNDAVKGSISLVGARLDDLFLSHYHETTAPTSPHVDLLAPSATKKGYYLESGWIISDQSIAVPTATTVWQTTGNQLSPQTPVTLSWTNAQGITFKRTLSLDDKYMFTVKETVINGSQKPFTTNAYALISKKNPDISAGSYALHEGAVGYLNGKLKEEKYKDIEKPLTQQTTGGWFGFTDKYWLTALIPNQSQATTTNFRSVGTEQTPRYQADFLSGTYSVAPGMTAENTFHFYAGPKIVEILDGYETTLGIPHFDLAIDFGWFYFITRPLFFLLKTLYNFFGNFALAIIVLTLLIRTALFPLAQKSYKSMAKMKELQPQLARIKEQAGDDKMKLNQEMMALYKQHKVNPVSGCLPMVLQIPFLFAIYKVLLISIEMRHAPLFGWIVDMSAPDPTTLFNLFGLIPWTPPSFLMVGALPILMGGTMYLQQKLSPQPTDDMQTKMFLIMPFIFTYMLAQFPAGVVFYWTLTNILAILQQWFLTKKGMQKT